MRTQATPAVDVPASPLAQSKSVPLPLSFSCPASATPPISSSPTPSKDGAFPVLVKSSSLKSLCAPATPTDTSTATAGPTPAPLYAAADPYPSLSPASLRKLLLSLPRCRTFVPPATAPPSSPLEKRPSTPTSVDAFPGVPSKSDITPAPTPAPAHVTASLLDAHSPASWALRLKLLCGTHLLIVQGGPLCKAPIYQQLHALGAHVHILDTGASPWHTAHASRSYISSFIRYDSLFDSSTLTLDHLSTALPSNVDFCAALTYYEDATVQAAKIATALGIAGPSEHACAKARSKQATREALRVAGLPTPRFRGLGAGGEELESAMRHVGFPAVLKPSFGAASIGVVKVCNEDEAVVAYDKLRGQMARDDDPLWTQGTGVLLEEYYDGDEFDVDVVLSGGEAAYAKVSDNWAVSEPFFQETGMHAPSLYPEDKQAEMVTLAVDAARALGFENGVLHIECRYTTAGARIIEVNGRMGGDPVYDFNRIAWGVNLVDAHALATLRIPVRYDPEMLRVHRRPVAEFVFNSPCSGVVAQDAWLEGVCREWDCVWRCEYFKKKGDQVVGPEDGVPDWIAELVFVGERGGRLQDLLKTVRRLVTQLRVPIEARAKGTAKKRLRAFFPDKEYPFVGELFEEQ